MKELSASKVHPLKSLIYCTFGCGLIIPISFFGFPWDYTPLLIFTVILSTLAVFCSVKFILVRKETEVPRTVMLIESITLITMVLLSIILALLFVKFEYENGQITKFYNENALYSIIVFVICFISAIWSAVNTKKYIIMPNSISFDL